MMNLFNFNGQEISSESILEVLSKVIPEKKDLYIALNLSSIGQISSSIKSRDHLSESLIHLFQELISPSNSIIMPAFTFSWGLSGSGFFSINDRTHLGVLPNYLISNSASYRSKDPMYSCVILGGNQNSYDVEYNDSFGKNSIFHLMHKKQNATIINFGTQLFNPSFIHYVEQYVDENIKKIEYRNKRKFKGCYKDQTGDKLHGVFYSFVRDLDYMYGYDYKRLEQDMINKGLLSTVSIGGATVQVSDCASLFDHLVECMALDVRYYLQ
jgi:aminoglycoside N3'-acetyltransferase